jgi:hypothetical protein
MMQSNPRKSGLGLLMVLLLLLLSSSAAWGEHHEKKEHENKEQRAPQARAKETKDEKVSRLAHKLKDLLERGVAVYESAEPQETALQQRQRDAAKGGLVRARDAATELVRDLDGGGDVYSSDVYFRVVDGNMQDALQTAGDFKPSPEGADILARIKEIIRKLRPIYDQG